MASALPAQLANGALQPLERPRPRGHIGGHLQPPHTTKFKTKIKTMFRTK